MTSDEALAECRARIAELEAQPTLTKLDRARLNSFRVLEIHLVREQYGGTV